MKCILVECLVLCRKMYSLTCIILYRDWNMRKLLEMLMPSNMTVLIHVSYILHWNLRKSKDCSAAVSLTEAQGMKKQRRRD